MIVDGLDRKNIDKQYDTCMKQQSRYGDPVIDDRIASRQVDQLNKHKDQKFQQQYVHHIQGIEHRIRCHRKDDHQRNIKKTRLMNAGVKDNET